VIPTIIISFIIMLLLSFPISILLGIVTTLAIHFYTVTPLTIIPQQLFNALDNFILLAIPFFILAGEIMTEGEIAQRLIDVMNVFVGRFSGGLALSTVVACMFFAALSGSSPATVVAIGTIMIPALKKYGYDEEFATGLVTSAGSLGIVIPPSIPMILYCLVMNVSVAKLFMAGIGPGILIGVVFAGYTIYKARKNGWSSHRKYSLSESLTILKRGAWGLMLPIIVLGGIYTGIFTPTEAAAVSVVYALFVELFIYRELTFKKLTKVLKDSAVLSGALLFILSCAMTFVWLLTSEQIPQHVANAVIHYVHNWWTFLIAVDILFLIMGTFMDDVSAMLILSPIFIETLNRFHIDLIHYGVVMVLVIEFGFLTPPFGLNLFVSMGITKWPLTKVARSVTPFILLLLLCVALVTFIPQISTFLPKIFYHY